MSPLSVLYVVFPFLILFFLHGIEEAVTQRRWMSKNEETLRRRIPSMNAAIDFLSRLTPIAIAFATAGEFFILLTLTALLLSGLASPVFMQLWFALFLAFSVRLVIRLVQAVIVRSYVPGLVTTLLALPFSISISGLLLNVYTPLHLTALAVAGTAFSAINLYIAHRAAIFLSRKLHKN